VSDFFVEVVGGVGCAGLANCFLKKLSRSTAGFLAGSLIEGNSLRSLSATTGSSGTLRLRKEVNTNGHAH